MKSDRNVISGENIETKYCFVVVYLHVKAALCVCITQVNTQINFYERVIKRPNTLWIYFLHKFSSIGICKKKTDSISGLENI